MKIRLTAGAVFVAVVDALRLAAAPDARMMN